MTVRTIGGTYALGYSLMAAYSELHLLSTGAIRSRVGSYGSPSGAGGVALVLPTGGTFVNDGDVDAGGGGGGHAAAGGAGGIGVVLAAVGSVANRGRIFGGDGGDGGHQEITYDAFAGGVGGDGVSLAAAGSITNIAMIMGGAGGAGGQTVLEAADGGAGGTGIDLAKGGTVVNTGLVEGGAGGTAFVGSYVDTGGAGGAGVILGEAGRIANSGTIQGGAAGAGETVGAAGFGVVLEAGGTIVNGSATNHAALITGGVKLYGAADLTNFGTVAGAAGRYAVELVSSSAVVLAEGGSDFGGLVDALDGKIDVASGVATFAAGLTSSGTINGAGTLALTGGVMTLDPGARLTVGKIEVSGATTEAIVAASALAYAGVWQQTAGTLTAQSGDRIDFTGASDRFTGTLAGAGTIEFTAGSATLAGASLAAARLIVRNAMTLSGAIALADTMTVTAPTLAIAATGATLAGTGRIALSKAGTSDIVGASAATLLTNAALIAGGGDLGEGSLTLDNAVGGVIDGDGTADLSIDTGAATVVNAGVLEATGGSGELAVESPIENSGRIIASNGIFFAADAVSGVGKVEIAAGGIAIFDQGLTENVAFIGSGTLTLRQSQTYAGQISGFSTTGATTLDLSDIAFSGATKATYAGAAASGVLTVTDGTHTAKITLIGNYLSAVWTVSDDGELGTDVTDPSAAAAKAAGRRFAAAAASLAPAPAAAAIGSAPFSWRPPPLACPRA